MTPQAPTDAPDPAAEAELSPVVEDLSAYIAGGRIRDSGEVLRQALDAERIGFRRVWLSERYDLKEAGVLLGAVAARTRRLELGTAALIPSSRPPVLTAALGQTLHSAFGPRLTLGLGRSMAAYISHSGLRPISREALLDYVDIYRRLWRGETVTSDGPAGRFTGLHLADRYDGPPPRVWAVHSGAPKACRMSADPLFDGVYLQPFLTVEAVRTSVGWIRAECERIGRDPATLRICLPIVSCPELPDEEARLQMHARMVTYLGQPGMGDVFARLNGWDATEVIRRVREHPMFAADPDRVDHRFHRSDLVEVAKLVPDEWMYPTSLTGSVPDCVARLAEYRRWVDEISTYGTSPARNAALVAAWRDRAADTPPGGRA